MDNRNTEQLAVPLEKEQESGRYGSILNVLKISAICFLLDDDLTVDTDGKKRGWLLDMSCGLYG